MQEFFNTLYLMKKLKVGINFSEMIVEILLSIEREEENSKKLT